MVIPCLQPTMDPAREPWIGHALRLPMPSSSCKAGPDNP
jgi:hypothetical protein